MDQLHLRIELEREEETGRWIADIPELPGVLVYGDTQDAAASRAKLLAMEVVLDRLANGEDPLTGCDPADACPPFDAVVEFKGLEFEYALAC